MNSIQLSDLDDDQVIHVVDTNNFSISRKFKKDIESVVQIHRVQGQKWRDSKGRVRDVSVGATNSKSKIRASRNAIKAAKRKPRKSDRKKDGGCSYLVKMKKKHGVELDTEARSKNVIDFGLYTDCRFSGEQIKCYIRERIAASCTVKSAHSKVYLEGNLDAIDKICDEKMNGVIQTVKDEPIPLEEKKLVPRVRTGKHKCTVCDFRTEYLSGMTRHAMTHTGEKPFKCGKCPKRFLLKSDRTRHELICGKDNKNKILNIKQIIDMRSGKVVATPKKDDCESCKAKDKKIAEQDKKIAEQDKKIAEQDKKISELEKALKLKKGPKRVKATLEDDYSDDEDAFKMPPKKIKS